MTHAPPLPDLGQLSDAAKDALIVALWTQLDAALAANAELMAKVAALTARVAELEAKLNEPPKAPDNSSLPPSHGHKANKPPRRKPRKGRRPGVRRELHSDPDHIVEARAETCPCLARRLWPRAIRSCRLSMSGSNCRRSSRSSPRSAFTAAPAPSAGRRPGKPGR